MTSTHLSTHDLDDRPKSQDVVHIDNKLNEPTEQSWTDAEERRVVRKLDWYLITM